jgi:hypothetical protein
MDLGIEHHFKNHSYCNKKSGQKMGKIKNTNKKKRNAQSAPIKSGYIIIPPFAFGFNVWAIMP